MIDLFAAGFIEAQRAAARTCRDMADDIAGRADPSRILELNMPKGPKA